MDKIRPDFEKQDICRQNIIELQVLVEMSTGIKRTKRVNPFPDTTE